MSRLVTSLRSAWSRPSRAKDPSPVPAACPDPDHTHLKAVAVIVRTFLHAHAPFAFNVVLAPVAVPPPSGRDAPESEWTWPWMVAVICPRERLAECRALVEGQSWIMQVAAHLNVEFTYEHFRDPVTLA